MMSTSKRTHHPIESEYAAASELACPVGKLVNNVIHKIESAEFGGVSQFAEAVNRGDISGQISISTHEERIRTPYVDLKTKDVCLPCSYLTHLWAFIYGILVTEERLQERLIAGSNDFSLEPRDDTEVRAWKLLNWSVSLVDEVTAWPDLPRPDIKNKSVENNYAEKVNSLFVDAVTFVVMHEYAHLTQGHTEFVGDDTAESAFERCELEKEADNFARDFLNRPYAFGEAGLVEALPVLLLMSSCLMLVSQPADLRQQRHPDLDDRLLHQLECFAPRGPHDIDYARLLCILVFRLFLIHHDCPRIEPFTGFETTGVALENVCKDMAALKQ